MKKIFVLILCLIIPFLTIQRGRCCVFAEEVKVEHFFTHELVYDAQKAYSPSNSLRKCFDRDHLTAKEFQNILLQLYERNFILVDIFDVYEKVGGKFKLKNGLNFGDKKPFILSFDDMTYDTKSRGVVNKIVEKDKKIYDYCENESEHLTQERDCVSILENFIEKNPTFSYNNARAILCVTGYNGMLGYRVFEGSYLPEETLEKEKEELERLVLVLKQKNYRFASHTYSHCNCSKINSNNLMLDAKRWEREIGKIVGETNIFCYPGGNHRSGSVNNEILKQKGFDVFLCTGNRLANKEENETGITYLYRHPLDGTALRVCKEEYACFFDTEKAYDNSRYLPFSFKEGY